MPAREFNHTCVFSLGIVFLFLQINLTPKCRYFQNTHSVSCPPHCSRSKKSNFSKMWCNHVKHSLVQSVAAMSTSSKSPCHTRAETHLHQFDLRQVKRDNTEKIREEKWQRRWEGDKKGLEITTVCAVTKELMKDRAEGRRESMW